MNMLKWAEDELEAAGYSASDTEEGPNKWLREGTLDLLKVFVNQGHSGMSAPFALELFSALAANKPLTPLSGNDSEWMEVGKGTWQNKRASNVFKCADKGAYNIEGIVFWEWWIDGETGEKYKSYFTNAYSRVPVTFPYTVPEKPEYREAVPARPDIQDRLGDGSYWAVEIKKLKKQEENWSCLMIPVNADYSPILLDTNYVAEYLPYVGGYYATCADGTEKFLPAGTFAESSRVVHEGFWVELIKEKEE